MIGKDKQSMANKEKINMQFDGKRDRKTVADLRPGADVTWFCDAPSSPSLQLHQVLLFQHSHWPWESEHYSGLHAQQSMSWPHAGSHSVCDHDGHSSRLEDYQLDLACLD